MIRLAAGAPFALAGLRGRRGILSGLPGSGHLALLLLAGRLFKV